MLEDATYADAILDRIVHTAYRIELRGESMRKRGMVNIEEVTRPMTTSVA